MNDTNIGTKRTATEEDENALLKRAKEDSGQVQIRLLILGQDCGLIIGRGGENMSRLRKEHQADVQIPPSRTVVRVFTTSGSQYNCIAVVKDVLQNLSKAPYSVGHQDVALEFNLLIESDLVGHIVGKSGSKVREIREETNAKIKVYPDCLPNSNERVVAIGADDPDHAEKILLCIFNFVQNFPRKAMPLYYNPENANPNNASDAFPIPRIESSSRQDNSKHDHLNFLQAKTEAKITVSNDMCGAIIGKGGATIRQIRETSGAKITFDEESEVRVITLSGTQQQVQYAEKLLTEACAKSTPSKRVVGQ